jgi:type IV pilus assembly protein PilW
MKDAMHLYFHDRDNIWEGSVLSSVINNQLSVRRRPAGFTLIEIMIAMTLGLVVIGGAYMLFDSQNKQLLTQQIVAEMQQNARSAMTIMSREIMMAGYNPSSASTLAKCTGITTTTADCIGIKSAQTNTISFTADLNGNGNLTADSTNPNENIVYERYQSQTSGVYSLGRTSNGGTRQPVIDHLDLLNFKYLDANDSETTDLDKIREVEITVQTIASKRDPTYPLNGGYRRYKLIAKVTPRNLGY